MDSQKITPATGSSGPHYSGLVHKPFLVLAPMDDVTDTVFRRVVAECAPPDLFFTEFVNVDGLQSPGRSKLLKKLLFTASEQPLVVQLWGKVPENFFKTARELADGTFIAELKELAKGRSFNQALLDNIQFAGIDLNMGCPVKAVVQNGCCSALINNRDLAVEIIAATQQGAGGRLPVSVKTRVGFREVDLTWTELLLGQKLSMLTVHGRTARQQSLVPANWDLIGQVRAQRDALSLDTLIVGNGDVESHMQAADLIHAHQLDGVMIGRGIFHNPFVFAKSSPWQYYGSGQRIALYRRHIELFEQTWLPGERPVQTLNKFCKVYINGFDGAKELREQLMAATTTDDLLAILAQSEERYANTNKNGQESHLQAT